MTKRIRTEPSGRIAPARGGRSKSKRQPESILRRDYPQYYFISLEIYGGSVGDKGIRAQVKVNVQQGPHNSTLIYVNFCDSAHLPNFVESIADVAGGPDYLYYPIELLPTILQIVRNEPSRAVWYTNNADKSVTGKISI